MYYFSAEKVFSRLASRVHQSLASSLSGINFVGLTFDFKLRIQPSLGTSHDQEAKKEKKSLLQLLV